MATQNMEIVISFLHRESKEPPTGLRSDGNNLVSCGHLIAHWDNGTIVLDKVPDDMRPAFNQHRILLIRAAQLSSVSVIRATEQ
ncbi:hypothetical protein LCGC14_0475820 [marine sediment metagenome]|uniref:Uncharacterized protein n=1 Tax=marine sediment metagenome TaxID=412755 RepID=A0A0F9SAR6_9ZZZZ